MKPHMKNTTFAANAFQAFSESPQSARIWYVLAPTSRVTDQERARNGNDSLFQRWLDHARSKPCEISPRHTDGSKRVTRKADWQLIKIAKTLKTRITKFRHVSD